MMLRSLLVAAVIVVSALASAEPRQTALAPDNSLYAVAPEGALPVLQLIWRRGTETKTILVPSTDDAAVESDPRLVWDAVSAQLFVVWHRAGLDGDAIRLASLAADGTWSEPMTIATSSSAQRAGLDVVLTHLPPSVQGGSQPTLVHLAWWKLGAEQVAEYALVAFENRRHVSTDVENLQDLAMMRESGAEAGAPEDVPETLHPPLAIARTASGEEVDVVFGATGATTLTRVKLRPKLVAGQARLWKPSRGSGGSLPKVALVSTNTAPVRSFISNGRVVLYTPDEQFRYVVYENGAWTPMRMIKVDAALSPDAILMHLRQAIDDEELEIDGDDGSKSQ